MLPIIDYTSPTAAQDFTRSLHETGFAVLSQHPIAHTSVQQIFTQWQAFFDSAEKFDYPFSADKFDGYFSSAISETAKGSTQKDLKEFYHVYPWGRIPPSLAPDIMAYYHAASSLAAQLLGWVEQHSPSDVAKHYSQSLSSMIDDSAQTLLRVLHYPPLNGAEPTGAVRAAAHSDINLLTLLPAANEPGLQVQTMQGDWLDVPCDGGLLIVNIGDMLQEASQGYFPSTIHRVMNPAGSNAHVSRLSLPLFLHPKPEVVLSKRHTAQSYLDERLRELGMKK
jgi:isopenicillin N synthase-like dioxygenase